MTTATIPHIRWMIRRDMPTVLQIEQQSFAQPWTEEDFLIVLRKRECIPCVAELPSCSPLEDYHLAGYLLYELRCEEFVLLNLAVAPACRRQGIGSRMVAKLTSKLRPDGRKRRLVDVRESNLAAQLFFRSVGFQAVCVRRDHYLDTGESAYRFVYRLTGE